MNITSFTGVAPGVNPQFQPSQPAKHNGQEGAETPFSEKDRNNTIRKIELEKEKENEKTAKIKAEDLIIKPSKATLEERLNQIISEEDVKDILSLVTGAPLQKDEDHKIDVKR
jgi:hypothetical protein